MSETATTANLGIDDELSVMRACAEAIDGLSEQARPRILRWLVDRYAADMPFSEVRSSVPLSTSDVNSSGITVKRFVQDKAPRTDVERVTVLAYYLSHHRGMQRFKTTDLSALNTEAAQPRFSNAANAASNALKSSGFLADAGKGFRQITAKGEEVVEALPDRDELKVVIGKYGAARRRRSTKSSGSKAEN